MPYRQIEKYTEWIALNFANGIYLVKDWLILNIGVGASPLIDNNSLFVDNIIKWGVGFTIIIFNIVRVVKYIKDIKEDKND